MVGAELPSQHEVGWRVRGFEGGGVTVAHALGVHLVRARVRVNALGVHLVRARVRVNALGVHLVRARVRVNWGSG